MTGLRGYVDQGIQAREILCNPFGDAEEKKEFLDYLQRTNTSLYVQIMMGGSENIANILRATQENNDDDILYVA